MKMKKEEKKIKIIFFSQIDKYKIRIILNVMKTKKIQKLICDKPKISALFYTLKSNRLYW